MRAAADAADAPNDTAALRLHAVLSAGMAKTDRMYPRLVNAMPTFIPDKKQATIDKAAVEVELPDNIAGLAAAAKTALNAGTTLSNLKSSKADIEAALENIEIKYGAARMVALKNSSDGTPPSPGDDVLMMRAIKDGKRMRGVLRRLTSLFTDLQGGPGSIGFQSALNRVPNLIAEAAAF